MPSNFLFLVWGTLASAPFLAVSFFPNPIIGSQGMDRDMHTLLDRDWGHDFICVSSSDYDRLFFLSILVREREEPIFDRLLLNPSRVAC